VFFGDSAVQAERLRFNPNQLRGMYRFEPTIRHFSIDPAIRLSVECATVAGALDRGASITAVPRQKSIALSARRRLNATLAFFWLTQSIDDVDCTGDGSMCIA
jgi:hypothetical protein